MNNQYQKFENTSLEDLLLNKNEELILLENKIDKDEYSSFQDILNSHNIILKDIGLKEKDLNEKLKAINDEIKINTECDKWDYILASVSGVLSGFIDSFFVGSPTDSKLINYADQTMDSLVQQFAKMNGWKGPKNGSNAVQSAIGFLERKFPVNYDQRYSSDVSGRIPMATINHHLKSLSHSPSPIGLIFSIIDQFNGTATFINNGSIITIDSESKLQGSNFPSKLFAAFINWIGHIMSDIAGSSGTTQRGSGVAIPFYELLGLCNFGSFGEDKKTLAEISVKVFEKGYDFRFGMVLSIPVVLTELFIRIFCIIRHRFQFNRPWRDCLEFLNFDKNARLRKMLLVGQGSLCLVDAGDAFIRSGFAQNWVEFFARLNFVAWMRFSYLGIRHSISLLKNETELLRYKLRAEAFDEYDEELNILIEKFFAEHNRKMDKYFHERQVKFNLLFNSLEMELKNNNYLSATKTLTSIGSEYGFNERFNAIDEFDEFMMKK